jgi:hypothetical protein
MNTNEKILINYIERKLTKSITDFNKNAINFKYSYEIKGDYIFGFIQSDLICSDINVGIYRMVCYSNNLLTDIFFDGNVGKGYNLETCKERTKIYINSVSNDINNLI